MHMQLPVFDNCACITENLALMNNMSTLSDEELVAMSTATVGVCENGCVSFGIFLGLSVITLFLTFILEIPNIVITIR